MLRTEHRSLKDETYRRSVDITGDPVSGRVESCRIRIAEGEVASRDTLTIDTKVERDAGGRILSVVILGFPGEPEDFDAALTRAGCTQADRNYIMGAMPSYFIA